MRAKLPNSADTVLSEETGPMSYGYDMYGESDVNRTSPGRETLVEAVFL